MVEEHSPQIPFLSDVRSAALAQSRDEFLANNPSGVLVIEPFMAPDETGFQTITGTKAQATEKRVAVIQKRENANSFGYMITMGRAGNNDLVVRYQGVSKFHAYIPVESGGGATRMVDAGSTNGTFVRGDRLPPRGDPVALGDGDEVRLADLSMVFMTAGSFYDFLHTDGS